MDTVDFVITHAVRDRLWGMGYDRYGFRVKANHGWINVIKDDSIYHMTLSLLQTVYVRLKLLVIFMSFKCLISESINLVCFVSEPSTDSMIHAYYGPSSSLTYSPTINSVRSVFLQVRVGA